MARAVSWLVWAGGTWGVTVRNAPVQNPRLCIIYNLSIVIRKFEAFKNQKQCVFNRLFYHAQKQYGAVHSLRYINNCQPRLKTALKGPQAPLSCHYAIMYYLWWCQGVLVSITTRGHAVSASRGHMERVWACQSSCFRCTHKAKMTCACDPSHPMSAFFQGSLS